MNDDALIAKAAEALWQATTDESHLHTVADALDTHAGDCAGCDDDMTHYARAVVAAVRDEIAAEALREAADEMPDGGRWSHLRRYGRQSWLRARAEALCAPYSDEQGSGVLGDHREAAGNSEGQTGSEG